MYSLVRKRKEEHSQATQPKTLKRIFTHLHPSTNLLQFQTTTPVGRTKWYQLTFIWMKFPKQLGVNPVGQCRLLTINNRESLGRLCLLGTQSEPDKAAGDQRASLQVWFGQAESDRCRCFPASIRSQVCGRMGRQEASLSLSLNENWNAVASSRLFEAHKNVIKEQIKSGCGLDKRDFWKLMTSVKTFHEFIAFKATVLHILSLLLSMKWQIEKVLCSLLNILWFRHCGRRWEKNRPSLQCFQYVQYIHTYWPKPFIGLDNCNNPD